MFELWLAALKSTPNSARYWQTSRLPDPQAQCAVVHPREFRACRAMKRLDEALLCFSKAKKGRFHNYLRALARGTVTQLHEEGRRLRVDSGCEAAAAGRLTQCRRLDYSHYHEQITDHDDWTKCMASLSIVLSFTGRSLSAEQVCRMVTVLIGSATQALPSQFVERSLDREVVFTIAAAPRSMIYWAEGGFTAYVVYTHNVSTVQSNYMCG